MNAATQGNLSNSLRKYRKARGLKQKEVAALLGVRGAGRVSKWESGRSVPSFPNLFKIAALYRVFVDALYVDQVHAYREAMIATETEYRKTHPRHG